MQCIYESQGLYTKISGNTIYNDRKGFGSGIKLAFEAGEGLRINDNITKGLNIGISTSETNSRYVNIQLTNNKSVSNTNLDSVIFNSYSTSQAGMKTSFLSSQPIRGTWNAGDIVYNTTGGTGWKCSASGTAGSTLANLASATSGSSTITFDSLVYLEVGQYINIAGVAGTKRIVAIDWFTGATEIDIAADATVSNAATSFVAPLFVALPF